MPLPWKSSSLLVIRYSLLVTLFPLLTACYSFRGITIPEGAERAFVPVFEDNALDAPPTLHIDVTEALRDKVRDEARLVVTDESPDLELKGTLVSFTLSSEGARPGNETAAYAALNRLSITVAIEYRNLMDPDSEGWRSNFSDFYDFPATQTLADVQDEAIETILEQINEKIFNRAFAEDW